MWSLTRSDFRIDPDKLSLSLFGDWWEEIVISIQFSELFDEILKFIQPDRHVLCFPG